MSTFDTNIKIESITDHAAGQKIKSIIGKYITHDISEELCDKIMNDLKEAFGENHPAQVNLDDETHDIEVIVRDSNGRFIKCSSRTLFPEEYL
jgi:sulfatase maturation enzyme AslB (radical SAM superfamily)